MAAQPETRAGRRGGCLGSLVRTCLWLLVFAVVALSLGAGAGTIVVQRTLPRTSGTLTAAGLTAAVTVIRDRWVWLAMSSTRRLVTPGARSWPMPAIVT